MNEPGFTIISMTGRFFSHEGKREETIPSNKNGSTNIVVEGKMDE